MPWHWVNHACAQELINLLTLSFTPQPHVAAQARPQEVQRSGFVIISESERGFWSNENGWVCEKASANSFPSQEVGRLPMSKGADAKVIPYGEAPTAFKD